MKPIIIFLLLLISSSSICYSQCQTCQSQNSDPNPYSCLSCPQSAYIFFISSCSSQSSQFKIYLAPAIIIILMHLLMLAVGMGVYRQMYQNIQMATIVTWKYGFQKGTQAIQIINFALFNDNNFTNTYAYQFVIILLVLFVFIAILAATDKMVHSPTAMLFRRKKIIFPVRIITLTFNALLLSSLAQITYFHFSGSFQIFPFILAIIALTTVLVSLVFVGVISNWKKFQVDDPHYYVLVQQMTTKKWYAKNNTLISLIIRTCIIAFYVGLFSSPQTAGIIIGLFQVAYTIYFIALLRFTKLRYFLINAISNILLVAIFMTVYIGSVNNIGGSAWNNCSFAYVVLIVSMIVFFFGVCALEVFFRKERVLKILKSFYFRFIKCEKSQDKIQLTKYDENGHRERVTEFHKNLLYQKDLSTDRSVSIEMQPTPTKSSK